MQANRFRSAMLTLLAATLSASATVRIPAIFHEQIDSSGERSFHGIGFNGAVSLDAKGMSFGPKGQIRMSMTGVTLGRRPQLSGEGVVSAWRQIDSKGQVKTGSAYSKVRYRHVYPGVDMLVYRKGSNIEYDFELAPGADPSSISVRIEGGAVKLDEDGSLKVDSTDGQVSLRKLAPRVFQKGEPLAAQFDLSDNEVRVKIAEFDPERPLTIDPVVEWSNLIGGYGSFSANPTVVALGSDGKLLVATSTSSTDFFLVRGPGNPAPADTFNGVLTIWRLNATGDEIEQYTMFEGQSTWPLDMAVATDGSIHVVGYTWGSGFPVVGGFITTTANVNCGFYAKLASNLSLTYSTLIRGTGLNNSAEKVAVGPLNDVYIAGYTESRDFPLVAATQTQPADLFLMRISGSGALAYSSYWGSRQSVRSGVPAYPNAIIALAANANGLLMASSGCTSPAISPGICDHPLIMFSRDLATVIWTRSMRTTSIPDALLWLSDGNALVGGAGPSILKLNSANGATVWSFRPTSGGGRIYSMAVDANGSIYGAGEGSVGTLPNAIQSTTAGGADGYVARLSSAGALLDSTYLGGSLNDSIRRVYFSGVSGVIYLAGTTESNDFPLTESVPDFVSRSSAPWIAKLDWNASRCETWTSPPETSRNSAGGSFDVRVFTTSPGCGWNFTSDQGWARLNNTSVGSGSATMRVTLDTNFNDLRVARFSSNGVVEHTIRQSNSTCELQLTGQRVVVQNSGGKTIRDYRPFGACSGLTWVPNVPWISAKITGIGFDPSFDRVEITVAPNNTGRRREGRIYLGGFFFRILQGAAGDGGIPKPVTPMGLQFVPVPPCRVADTRNPNGPLGGPFMTLSLTRDFPVPQSACGIPSGASAYSMNVTVVPRGPLGFLTIWPAGQSQPVVSTLNALDGRIKANAAIVPAGTNGAVSVYVTGPTDVILDINGYFITPNNSNLAFYPISPCRISDTRNPMGSLGGPVLAGLQPRTIPVRSSGCSIPASAQAYSLNATVVPRRALGYLTMWPSGVSQPVVSTLNALTGTVVANAAIVPAGSAGSIDVFATDDTELILDINGYFAPPGAAGALKFYALTPCRISDTRLPNGPFGGPTQAALTGRNYVFSNSECGVPGNANAFSVSATVVPPGPLGYLTLWPAGSARPTVSTLNALDGAITSNAALLPVGTGGAVSAFGTDLFHLLLDVNGYFAP